MDTQQKLCPCSSKKPYELCCQPFHSGELPKTALELMRSRFSAYALNLPEYIVATTHPANPHYSENKFAWKRSISKFSREYSFDSLEVLDFKEHETLATVIFTAYITHEDNDCTFTEKSFFERFHGRWLYRGGQLEQGHAPNLVTTDQLRLLPLAYYGAPILRKKSEEVTEITQDMKNLIDEMIETMDACNGMGLAAPQVHHSAKVFIIRTPIEKEDGKIELGKVKVFVNPKIRSTSKETWKAAEGCLSLPTIRAEIERSKEISLEYTNLDGIKKTEIFRGWEAKVILHENDHLEGVLFIDHMNENDKKKLSPFLKNLKSRIHDGTEM